MISHICMRSAPDPPALVANDFTDCGNLTGKDILGGGDVEFIVKAISTFVNHGVCLENFEGRRRMAQDLPGAGGTMELRIRIRGSVR